MQGLSLIPQRPQPPTTVTIEGAIYAIHLVDEADIQFNDEKETDHTKKEVYVGVACDTYAFEDGYCVESHAIYIATEQTLFDEKDTVIHELLHVILGTQNSDRSITKRMFIKKLAVPFVRLLQRNPALVAYLTGVPADGTNAYFAGRDPELLEQQAGRLRDALFKLCDPKELGDIATYHDYVYEMAAKLLSLMQGAHDLVRYLSVRTD